MTLTRMRRASATCARSLRHGGRNQCTTGRRAGGHRRNRYAAIYAVFVYSVVILSQASLRAPSSPRKTRVESRATSCRTCSRRVISHHSRADLTSALGNRMRYLEVNSLSSLCLLSEAGKWSCNAAAHSSERTPVTLAGHCKVNEA